MYCCVRLHTFSVSMKRVWRCAYGFHVHRFIAQFVRFLSKNWHRVTYWWTDNRSKFDTSNNRSKQKNRPFFSPPCDRTVKRWIFVYFSFFSLSFDGSVHRLKVIHLRQIGRLTTALQPPISSNKTTTKKCVRSIDPRICAHTIAPITRATKKRRKNDCRRKKCYLLSADECMCSREPHKLVSLVHVCVCVRFHVESPFRHIVFSLPLPSISASIFCGSVLATVVAYRASHFHTNILIGFSCISLADSLFALCIHTHTEKAHLARSMTRAIASIRNNFREMCVSCLFLLIK